MSEGIFPLRVTVSQVPVLVMLIGFVVGLGMCILHVLEPLLLGAFFSTCTVFNLPGHLALCVSKQAFWKKRRLI